VRRTFKCSGSQIETPTQRKCFFCSGVHFAVNNRIFVLSDFAGEPGCYYEIKGTNHWPNHAEALIIPIIGEASWIFNSNATAHVWDDNFAWDDGMVWND
jgi:hypothetical protein